MTTFRENIAQTRQQPEHYDLYIPAITGMHVLLTTRKTDRYNERPWGGGFGQSRWDEKETGMACMQWHLRTRGTNGNRLPDTDGKVRRPLADENFHLGTGFTAGVTARDNWNYIPLPVLLPLASVGYGPRRFR